MTNNPSGGCGCRIVLGEPNQEPQGIEYCPIHLAAPKLLEALKVAIYDHGWEYALKGDAEKWKELVARAEAIQGKV